MPPDFEAPPVILRGDDPALESKLEELVTRRQPHAILDSIDEQLEEIARTRFASAGADSFRRLHRELLRELAPTGELWRLGSWVYFPWLNELVHYLPEELHTELRTSRNRDLITASEQRELYDSSVAVLGLSTGNGAAAVLALEGIGRDMRLADMDRLQGSNLNRIRSTFAKVGMHKTSLLAQELYELNPYSELQLFPEGVTEDNVRRILLEPRPADVIVDEIDNVYFKLKVREVARAECIPVVTALNSGDATIIDVERYDLEPDRPYFSGSLSDAELRSLRPKMPIEEVGRLLVRLAKPTNVPERLQDSLLRVGSDFVSFSQLGGTAIHTGVVLAYAVRKILLGEPLRQNVTRVGLDEDLDPFDRSPRRRARHDEKTRAFCAKLGIPATRASDHE